MVRRYPTMTSTAIMSYKDSAPLQEDPKAKATTSQPNVARRSRNGPSQEIQQSNGPHAIRLLDLVVKPEQVARHSTGLLPSKGKSPGPTGTPLPARASLVEVPHTPFQPQILTRLESSSSCTTRMVPFCYTFLLFPFPSGRKTASSVPTTSLFGCFEWGKGILICVPFVAKLDACLLDREYMGRCRSVWM